MWEMEPEPHHQIWYNLRGTELQLTQEVMLIRIS